MCMLIRVFASYAWALAHSLRGRRQGPALPSLLSDAPRRYVSRVTVSHSPSGATLVKATAGDRLICTFAIYSIIFTFDSSIFSLLENEWVIQPSTRAGSSVVKFSVAFRFKRCRL